MSRGARREGRLNATALALALVLGVVVGACARPAASPSPSPTVAATTSADPGPSAAAVVIPSSLQGMWTAHVAGTSASSGDWQLHVTANDMLLKNPVGGDEFSINPAGITDTTLTLAPDPGCPDQPTVTAGSYTYVLASDVLTITAVSDSCGDRKGVLTAAPWSRSGATGS